MVNNGQEAVERLADAFAAHHHDGRVHARRERLRCARAIRERGQGHRVPIIGVTAHALESDRELCLDAGMDDYMSQPIRPELLEGKIRPGSAESDRTLLALRTT